MDMNETFEEASPDCSEAEIDAEIRRRLTASARDLSKIVAMKIKALRKLQAANEDTSGASREVSAGVLAMHRTLEMKNRIGKPSGAASEVTREHAQELLDLNDADVADFIRTRKAAPESARAGESLPDADAETVAGARS